jgi:hypothetical protein
LALQFAPKDRSYTWRWDERTLTLMANIPRGNIMVTTQAPAPLGAPAPEFRLIATDGKTYALNDIAGSHGTVIVFICNHCPYVKAVIDRLVRD